MRRLILLPLMFFVLAGFAHAKGYEMSGKAGDYTVNVTFERSPFEEGSNVVEVEVLDAASKPVSDATVIIDYFMPTLPDKSSMMSYAARATTRGKTYRATLNLSMSGEWTFVINVMRDGKTDAMAFALVAR